MLAYGFSLAVRATLFALLLSIGVSHAAVGEQYLDPGPVFGSAAKAAAPTAAPAIAAAPVRVTAPAFATAPQQHEAARAAVGQARLDPGLSSGASAVAALTIEQEMVYLRAEIRKAAHDKAVAALAQQHASSAPISDAATNGSRPFQERLIWLQPIGSCIAWSPPLLWPGGSVLTAARREYCAGVIA